MMSFRQAKKFLVIVISTLMLVATIVFNFGTTSAWAATLPAPFTSQFIAMNRAEAMTKNLEGQAQEALGNVTGSRKDQMMGRLKQTEGSHRNMIENVKDGIGDLFN